MIIILSLMLLYVLWIFLSFFIATAVIVVYGPLVAMIVATAYFVVCGKEFFRKRPNIDIFKTNIILGVVLLLGTFYTLYKYNYGQNIEVLTGVMSMILPLTIMIQALRS